MGTLGECRATATRCRRRNGECQGSYVCHHRVRRNENPVDQNAGCRRLSRSALVASTLRRWGRCRCGHHQQAPGSGTGRHGGRSQIGLRCRPRVSVGHAALRPAGRAGDRPEGGHTPRGQASARNPSRQRYVALAAPSGPLSDRALARRSRVRDLLFGNLLRDQRRRPQDARAGAPTLPAYEGHRSPHRDRCVRVHGRVRRGRRTPVGASHVPVGLLGGRLRLGRRRSRQATDRGGREHHRPPQPPQPGGLPDARCAVSGNRRRNGEPLQPRNARSR